MSEIQTYRQQINPPANTLRVEKWADLPTASDLQAYLIKNDGQAPYAISIAKHERHVLDGLRNGPIFAASICRVSHYVNLLRTDYGVDIHCERYSNDRNTGRTTFGVYFLKSQIVPVAPQVAA